MLLRPNAYAQVLPESSWEVDSYRRYLGHPCLLVQPTKIQTLTPNKPGIEAPLLAPPPIVMAACFARQWKINASLTGGGFTLSAVDELINLTPEGDPVINWSRRFSYGGVAEYEQTEEEEDEISFITLRISIGSLSAIQYGWSDGKWWPGIAVSVSCRDHTEEDDLFGYGDVGFGHLTVGAEMPITLTVCGEEIPMFYATEGGDAASISGTITIDPEEYLDIE